MKLQKDRIEEIKNNGYQLDFGPVFEQAFENYKKIALYAGLMIFVFTVLIFALIAVIAISFLGIVTLTELLKPENLKPENLSGTFMLGYIGVLIMFTVILSPFPAGLIKMAYCAERDEEFHVSTAFEFYKAPYFIELVIATFLISIFSSGLSFALDFVGIQFLGSLISIAISLFTLLTIPLIIFSNMKAIDALQTSIMIVSKQPLILLGLLIVSFIGSLVGFIGCCIGVFFTLPFMYSMYYSIYNQIIGFDSEE